MNDLDKAREAALKLFPWTHLSATPQIEFYQRLAADAAVLILEQRAEEAERWSKNLASAEDTYFERRKLLELSKRATDLRRQAREGK